MIRASNNTPTLPIHLMVSLKTNISCSGSVMLPNIAICGKLGPSRVRQCFFTTNLPVKVKIWRKGCAIRIRHRKSTVRGIRFGIAVGIAVVDPISAGLVLSFSHIYIAADLIIAAIKDHQAGHKRIMGKMIHGKAAGIPHHFGSSGKQIMNKGNFMRNIQQAALRKQQVMIYRAGTMTYLNKDVLIQAAEKRIP